MRRAGALLPVTPRASANPWRAVAHSELATNARGQDYWLVTLECGHRKSCYLPNLQLLPALVRMRGPKPKSRLAPRRCRCLICGALAQIGEMPPPTATNDTSNCDASLPDQRVTND